MSQRNPMPPTPKPFAGQMVRIETWDGRKLNATPLPAEHGWAWDVGQGAPVAPDAVKTVTKSNTAASAGIGAGLGALSGLVVGILIGLSAGDDQCRPNDFGRVPKGPKGRGRSGWCGGTIRPGISD